MLTPTENITYGKKLVLRTNENALIRGMGSESVTSLLCDLGWVEVTRPDHEEFSSNYKLCKNTVSLSGHVTRVVCRGVGIYRLKSAVDLCQCHALQAGLMQRLPDRGPRVGWLETSLLPYGFGGLKS